jgi:hypothetical protein
VECFFDDKDPNMLATQERDELIARWTEGLTNVTRLEPVPDMILLVCKDAKEKYHVTSFFTVGGRWTASVDAQAVGADEAFKALERRMR